MSRPQPARVRVPITPQRSERLQLVPDPPLTLFLNAPAPERAPRPGLRRRPRSRAQQLWRLWRASVFAPERLARRLGGRLGLRLLSLALLSRLVGGALCALNLVFGAPIFQLTAGGLSLGQVLGLTALVVLVVPPLGLLASLLRAAAIHGALRWWGCARRPLEQTLRAGVLGASAVGPLGWLPGVGVGLSVVWECRAIAGAHGLPLQRVMLASMATAVVPLSSAVVSGAITAALIA